MHVAMIGSGYVGLVSGACFSEFGVNVICVDNIEDRIQDLNSGKIPIYEPGLAELVEKNVKAGRLSFTSNISDAVATADVVMLAVGTPSRRGDGHADLSFVHAAAKEVAEVIQSYTVIVTKSTVPVGTGEEITAIIRSHRPHAEFDIVSNPEFLREGAAIEDFMRPDRIVVGVESDRAKSIMTELYRPLFLIETPVLFTSIRTAELIKYAANTFLATKITFINEIADVCEAIGADVHDVAKGIGLDRRIGSKFLHPGPGYGGSCFPKDTMAFVKIAGDCGAPSRIVDTVVKINEERKFKMAEKVIKCAGGSVAGKCIAILGVAFKPNTDDVRESASLTILPALQADGALIQAFDPEGMDEGKKLLSDIKWCSNSYEAMENADILVILTEWNQFRALDLGRIKKLLKNPVIVDLRNIYDPDAMLAEGFKYYCIGRPVAGVGSEE